MKINLNWINSYTFSFAGQTHKHTHIHVYPPAFFACIGRGCFKYHFNCAISKTATPSETGDGGSALGQRGGRIDFVILCFCSRRPEWPTDGQLFAIGITSRYRARPFCSYPCSLFMLFYYRISIIIIGRSAYTPIYYRIIRFFIFSSHCYCGLPPFLSSNPNEVESISRPLAPELALFSPLRPLENRWNVPSPCGISLIRGDQHCMWEARPDGFTFDNFARSMQTFSLHKGSRDSIASGPPVFFLLPLSTHPDAG